MKDGKEYWGFWQDDERHGEGWVQFPDGTGHGVEYENGELIESYESNQ
jgi:hypothetical protein